MLILMALRNVVRNLYRSAITASAIALGLAAMLFLWGFKDGAHNSMTRNLQQTVIGSIQIHSKGFFRRPTLEGTLVDREMVDRELDRLGVSRRTNRLRAFALAAGDQSSEGLDMYGISPKTERLTTILHTKVNQGRFLQPGDNQACVLGATTANHLGLSLNDDVILLATDRYGSPAADRFELVGIIGSGEIGIDRGLVIVPLESMQVLLGMEDRITDIVIQLPRQELERTSNSLRAILDPENYEVLRWHDMYPVMLQWVELETAFFYIFLGIVLFIVSAGIMNTILMSTLERTHEFGVMMALGCSRWRLAAMVATESVLLGLIGIVFGTVLGLALVAVFGRIGIDLSEQMETTAQFYINPVVYTEINLDHLAITVSAVVLAALLAAMIPALRAARLEPVEAVRYV